MPVSVHVVHAVVPSVRHGAASPLVSLASDPRPIKTPKQLCDGLVDAYSAVLREAAASGRRVVRCPLLGLPALLEAVASEGDEQQLGSGLAGGSGGGPAAELLARFPSVTAEALSIAFDRATSNDAADLVTAAAVRQCSVELCA